MAKFQKGNPGRPKGAVNVVTRDMREWMQKFLTQDKEYQDGLQRRIRTGRAPHMETFFWRHLLGDPDSRLRLEQSGEVKLEISWKSSAS